jgi:hypothetical protein
MLAGKALPNGLTEVWVTEFREIAHLSTTCGSLSNKFAIRKRICPQCGQNTRAGKWVQRKLRLDSKKVQENCTIPSRFPRTA